MIGKGDLCISDPYGNSIFPLLEEAVGFESLFLEGGEELLKFAPRGAAGYTPMAFFPQMTLWSWVCTRTGKLSSNTHAASSLRSSLS